MVSLSLSGSVTQYTITLNTNVQAVSVNLAHTKSITICLTYIPPGSVLDTTDLESPVLQLPTPFLLLGDLNVHNPLWGNKNTNGRGRNVENI